MRFEFATAGRIIFGSGQSRQVPDLAAGLGKAALVVTGRDASRAKDLLDCLSEAGLQPVVFQVPGEPTTDLALEGAELARRQGCDVVIGFGGGSVIDAGKAIAALATNPGDILDYLEVIGCGQPLLMIPAPYIAVPTTAGTGAEVTRNAVLGSPVHRVKVSMRSPHMLPKIAVVDPALTASMSAELTASTGLDALTQLLEVFVCNQPNPLTDAVCREGLGRAARSLRRACERGDAAAREDMALASLFGGLALANAKLGAVHGFAGPVGGMFPAPHGVVCARLLPHVMEANVRALENRAPDSPALERYRETARILTGDPAAEISDGISWIREICLALRVPALGEYGITSGDFPDIVEKAREASSMKGNPIELTRKELAAILQRAM